MKSQTLTLINTKKSARADFGDSTQVESNLTCHLRNNIQQEMKFVNITKGVEVAGLAPAEPWMTSQILYLSTPTPQLLLQNTNTNTS